MKSVFSYLKNLFTSPTVLETKKALVGVSKADAFLEAMIADKKVPGMAVTVLREGKVVLQKGYGYANINKKLSVDPEQTIFRIASVSKPLAATALAHMVADKSMDLDASLYSYVPYFPKKKYDFTIRQLASHTAGFRGYKGKEYALNKPYSIKEGIKVFQEDALLFQPGTDYLYNSFDWSLLSLAMQEAVQTPIEEYIAEKVLEPLDMNDTFPEISGEIGSNYATFYSKNRLGFREAVPVNNFYKLAGGGYLSTAADVARLGQAYLDKKISTAEVLTSFLTSEKLNEVPTYYGLGWQVSVDKKGRPYYGHVGNGVGGYANFYVYPKEQMVFSILINCTNPLVQSDLDDIIDLMIESKDVNQEILGH